MESAHDINLQMSMIIAIQKSLPHITGTYDLIGFSNSLATGNHFTVKGLIVIEISWKNMIFTQTLILMPSSDNLAHVKPR